jgi:hypothetical protein
MGNFVFQDLDFHKTIWRAGDPPLVNGSGPVIEGEPTAKPARSRLLLWLGVLASIAIGARLVALLVAEVFYPPIPVTEDVIYRMPGVTVAVGVWLIICLLAIMRAWRKSQRKEDQS